MSAKTKYVCSAVYAKDYPDSQLIEVALAGRSNVGKSSLINRLGNRRNLARISSSPGKTRTINFYILEELLMLVDLPGYGYAKVSQRERQNWADMINNYLNNRQNLGGIIQLVDLRHPPSALDLQMATWIKESQLPFLIVATKSDKLSRNIQQKQLNLIRQELNLNVDEIIAFSAVTNENKDKIWTFLKAIATKGVS